MTYGMSALRSIDYMRQNQDKVKRAVERLSSGLRINRSEDDPSGHKLSVGGFRARMSRIQAGLENLELATSFADLRWDGLNNTREAMYKLKDLLVRAANDATLTTDDRTNIQTEIDGLLASIDHNRDIAFRINENSPGGSHTLYNPGMLDVVWVFDGTGSMNQYHAQAAALATQMFDGFEANGFDLKMAAVGYEGTGLGAYPFGGVVTLGGPVNAILAPNGWTLVDNDVAFAAQAGACALPGGDEMGMDAIVEAVQQFSNPPNANGFRAAAQKVILLVTDADSDDQGSKGGAYPANVADVAASIEQQAIDALNNAGITMMYVGNLDELTPIGVPSLTYANDYANIAAATGGASILLDTYELGPPAMTWVNTVTTQLEAFGGPWDARFHWGPDSDNFMEVTFQTVVPSTMGIAGLSASSTATAQNSLDALDDGFEFLNQALVDTGTFRSMVQRAIDTQMDQYHGLASINSDIADADIAAEVTNYARGAIAQDAAVATLSHAFQSIQNLMNLIESNLGAQAAANVATPGLASAAVQTPSAFNANQD